VRTVPRLSYNKSVLKKGFDAKFTKNGQCDQFATVRALTKNHRLKWVER